jgi:hypothetical protein
VARDESSESACCRPDRGDRRRGIVPVLFEHAVCEIRDRHPFADRNLFFGLSLIHPTTHAAIVENLRISWLSLQPHVLWMAIEREPGVYDWENLDEEVRTLQTLGLDITMVLSPPINAFGDLREEVVDVIAA